MDRLVTTISKYLTRTRFTIFEVSLGFGVLVALAAIFRHRRSRLKLYDSTCNGDVHHIQKDVCLSRTPNGLKRHSGNTSHYRTSRGPGASLASSLTNVSEISTAATITDAEGRVVSPHDLCDMGLETLQRAIECWEDAMTQVSSSRPSDEISTDRSELIDQLQHLLEMSYHIQDEYERRCVRHADHMAIDSAITAIADMDYRYDSRRPKSMADTDITSDRDSFVSATDLADLSDLDTHRELFHHLGLYEAGLMELKHGHIPCRTLRTDMTGCLSDTEFLAKLHGIRFAMELLLNDPTNRSWFIDSGRSILLQILEKCNKETGEFISAYDAMMVYILDTNNHPHIMDELRHRGVKCMSFYDIALDFIMMDAFDDLDNPPTSVTAIARNRWLSDSFKETALNTAIWSVLKAKRKLLRQPNGFIAHFYQISEHISPVLAWGLMGPDTYIKPIAIFFKELVQGFIQDVFSFDKVRYTSLEHLAEDIMTCARNTEKTARQFMT